MSENENKVRLSRRALMVGGSIVSAGLLIPRSASAALHPAPRPAGPTTRIGDVTVKGVTFKNNDITMSGNVYLPKGFTKRRTYPTIVVVDPGGASRNKWPACTR